MIKAKFFLIIVCCSLLHLVSLQGALSANQKLQYHTEPNIDEALTKLKNKMSQIKTVKTNFIQEKKLAILNEKLILQGTFFLQKPDLFAWHVKKPIQYSLLIKDDIVRQWDEDTKQIQRISLSKNPAFNVVAGQIKEWFFGTYISLLEKYKIIKIEHDPICLTFIPREDAITSKMVKSVTISFRKDERYIQQIFVEENSGDSMLLKFIDTELNIPIDAAAWEVKPGV